MQVLDEAMRGEGRRRTLARYELVLEAARRPEIHRALATGTERILERLAALFPSIPPDEARLRARDVLAFLDGLLLANVTSPDDQRQSPAELAAALDRVLGS